MHINYYHSSQIFILKINLFHFFDSKFFDNFFEKYSKI